MLYFFIKKYKKNTTFIYMIMKKAAMILLAFSGFMVVIFFMAGMIVDATEKPVKSDVIVVLGGDWEGYRIKKGLELYRQNYSKSGLIIVNKWNQIYVKDFKGSIYRKDDEYLLGNGIDPQNIVTIRGAGKTMYEIRAIKQFMLDHNFHSVLVVTDAPHSRRVKMLANTLENFPENGLKITVVAAGQPWWDKHRYYKNRQAIGYTV